MNIDEIKFNLLLGRNSPTGKTIQILGGTECPLITLKGLQQLCDPKSKYHLPVRDYSADQEEQDRIKERLPAIQIFNDGCRSVRGEHGYDWSHWNGVVCVDIDSKKYKGDKKIKWDALEQRLFEKFSTAYEHTFIGIQRSFSGKSWHLFFGFDCDRNEETFRRCTAWCAQIVTDAFTSINLRDVIAADGVLDRCTDKPTQPIFFAGYPLRLNEFFDGYCKMWDGTTYIFDFVEIRRTDTTTSSDIRIVQAGEVDENAECWSRDFYFDHNVTWRLINILRCVYPTREQGKQWYDWFIDSLQCDLHHSKEWLKRDTYFNGLWDSLSRNDTPLNRKLMEKCSSWFGWEITNLSNNQYDTKKIKKSRIKRVYINQEKH